MILIQWTLHVQVKFPRFFFFNFNNKKLQIHLNENNNNNNNNINNNNNGMIDQRAKKINWIFKDTRIFVAVS